MPMGSAVKPVQYRPQQTKGRPLGFWRRTAAQPISKVSLMMGCDSTTDVRVLP